jgi:Domain of unknown function (DUF4397)
MKNTGRLLILLAPIALAGCGGDNSYYPSYPAPAPGTYANLQFVNASPDAPPIDVLIDGTPWVRHLDYGEGTGEQSIAPGSHSIVVQVETPGAPTTVIGPTTLDAAVNMDYVVAVEGYLNSIQSPGVTLVTFPHQLAIVPAESVRVQVLSATYAFSGNPVQVYLTPPGADLSASAPLGTVPYGGSVGPTEVSAGEWEIRVTQSQGASPSASPSDNFQIYDSGPITLEGGTDLVFSLVPDLLPEYCPPYLFCPASGPILSVVDALGNTNWVHVNPHAVLSFVHVSPDAPALGFTTNGSPPSAADAAVATTIAYGDSTPSGGVLLTPGINVLAIEAASNPSDVLASRAVDARPNGEYTLYALGPLAQLSALVTHDDLRAYSTQARLRFIQGSPSADLVDVYLTATGSGIANATPTYAGLPLTGNTGFVSYVQGDYDLTITEAGSQTPILGPISACLQNGEVSTIVLRDAPGGGPPYGLIGELLFASFCE